jgi:hypothetical protein
MSHDLAPTIAECVYAAMPGLLQDAALAASRISRKKSLFCTPIVQFA